MPTGWTLGFIGSPTAVTSVTASTSINFSAVFRDSDSAQRVTGTFGHAKYVFSGLNFGTAAGNRLLVTTLCYGEDADPIPTPGSVHIGGVQATLVVARNDGEAGASIWQALVPSGTSGVMSVSFTVGTLCNAIALGLWSVYTNTQAATNSGGSTAGASVAATVPANGYGIVAYCCDTDTGVELSDGVTPSNYTEDWDIVPSTAGTIGTLCNGGHITSSATIDATPSETPVDQCLVYASWGP